MIFRYVIVVSARIHPGETNSSWVMDGFLTFITSNTAAALFLRDHVIFKIVPMLNPDGVVLGNFRSSFTGKDLNRVFKSLDIKLFPEVIALKNLI
jgi:murein tripeptide amidase MpaA